LLGGIVVFVRLIKFYKGLTSLKCIVGLGNPGKKYADTKHNIGFMVIDELLKRHQWQASQSKFSGDYTVEHLNGEKILLLKPQTFMNLSGECIRPFIDFYKIDPADVLVVYDDLDLPVGTVRLRETGGHGGHNGVRSTIDQLGTKAFKRLRIGVGRPTGSMPVVNYVLAPFEKDQEEDVKISIYDSADACEEWLNTPFANLMNKYHAKR